MRKAPFAPSPPVNPPLKIWLLLGCSLALFGRPAQAEFTLLGPVETLDNGTVTLQVALHVGRIVSYHRHGEADWLVVHDEPPRPGWNWNPWGGDRMWPTSQAINYQIYHNNGFDPVIDGQPWDLISKTPVALEMRSGISPQLGLRVTHRIELIGKTAGVLHTYRVERLSESNFPVQIWTVTGVRADGFMLMESDPRIKHDDYKPYKTWLGQGYTATPAASLLPHTRILRILPPEQDALKLGAYGRWVALVSGGSAFFQSVDYLPAQLYMDACNLESFIDPATGTYELETISPTWFLRKGETRKWTVRWRLLTLPPAAKEPAAAAAFLQAQADAKGAPLPPRGGPSR